MCLQSIIVIKKPSRQQERHRERPRVVGSFITYRGPA